MGQPYDAKAGAEALFGMRTLLEDDLAECCRCRSNPGCILTDARHGPAGVAAMAGRPMLGNGGLLVIATHAVMGGNAFALKKNLYRAHGEAHLPFGPGKTMGDTVIVVADLDVIIDADAAGAPFGQDAGLRSRR